MQTKRSLSVMVLGGYGNFGRIICERLSTIAGINLTVAGRNVQRAESVAVELGCDHVAIDADAADLGTLLARHGINLVISTVGPFQHKDYRVAEAAVAAGAHYIDIADARSFVTGITRLDPVAKERRVSVISGASSVPALAAAVIDQHVPLFASLRHIHHGISSSEKMPGLATVHGVLEYCGKPFLQWRDGSWRPVYGWQDLYHYRFRGPLGRRITANCDVPDLDLLQQRYPSVETVRFSAGPGLSSGVIGTWALAWLVRARLLKSASKLAPQLHRIAVSMSPLGDGMSGMFVQLRGPDTQGQELNVAWEMIALDNHGPNIPCMAAVALTRKLAQGTPLPPGAMPCTGLLTLDDYLAELRHLNITTHCTQWTT